MERDGIDSRLDAWFLGVSVHNPRIAKQEPLSFTCAGVILLFLVRVKSQGFWQDLRTLSAGVRKTEDSCLCTNPQICADPPLRSTGGRLGELTPGSPLWKQR